jgi:hypothetical protein
MFLLQFLRDYQFFILGSKLMLVYSLLSQPQLRLQLHNQLQDLLLQLRHATIVLLLLTCCQPHSNDSFKILLLF